MPSLIKAILPDDPMAQWVMFILAMVGLSFAGQVAAQALDRTGRAARRALGYLLPVAVGAVMAILWGRPQMALAIVSGSAVGAIFAAGGTALLISPVSRLAPGAASLVRFVLPVGVLLLLAGFSGHFGWIQAGVFAVQGLALLAVFGQGKGLAAAGEEAVEQGDEDASADQSEVPADQAPGDENVANHAMVEDATKPASAAGVAEMTAAQPMGHGATTDQAPSDETKGHDEQRGRSFYSDSKISAASTLIDSVISVVGGRHKTASANDDQAASCTVCRRRWMLAGAVLLAMVCGLLMMGSAMSPTSDLARVPQEMLGATVLAPILLLSCIGGTTTAAQHGRGADALAQVSVFALLAICLLLPLSIALYRIQPLLPAYFSPEPLVQVDAHRHRTTTAATSPAATSSADEGELANRSDAMAAAEQSRARTLNLPVLYPTMSWRMDAPLLCAAGMLLLGLSLGKIPLTSRTGFVMLIGYVLYLVVYAGGTR